MTMFDLNNTIAKYNINVTELAPVLFPSVKYPKAALDRVLKYEATLNIEQVVNLATYLNVSTSDLFTNQDCQTSRKNGKLVFTKGEVSVTFFVDNYYYSIYKNGECVKQVVDDGSRLTVEDFLNIINKY